MITPPYLQQGDKVAVVAPARKVTPDELYVAVTILESWGLKVVYGRNLYSAENQFAGSDLLRRTDFQDALDDPEVRAIFCARGGYGSVRFIEDLDFSGFIRYPKWIAGYSDITVFHSHVNRNFDIETLHCTMPFKFSSDPEDRSMNTLKTAIFGEPLFYEMPAGPLCKPGEARGELVGGNLSIIHTLTGTSSDIHTQGKILFIEDIEEYLYHIDRMMVAMKRTGKLGSLAGLIVGGMTGMMDNQVPFGQTANEIISHYVSGYDFPVCFDFPAGHLETNSALILGRTIKMSVNKTIKINFNHATQPGNRQERRRPCR